jgi:hypothetical protein
VVEEGGVRASASIGSTFSRKAATRVHCLSGVSTAQHKSLERYLASSRGVYPSLSRACGSAPCSTSSLTISSRPLKAATCSGVARMSVLAATSAPRSSSSRTASALVPCAEQCSAVQPDPSLASTLLTIRWSSTLAIVARSAV